MRIKQYRKLKNVNRLSRHSLLRPYSLMEHSYMVAVLFKKFAALEDVPYTMAEFDLVLHHDILEVVSGDIPHDVKNLNSRTQDACETIDFEIAQNHPELRPYTDYQIREQLTDGQYKLLKCCDLLDLWIFIKEEQRMGNRDVELDRVRSKCVELIQGKFRYIDAYMNLPNPLDDE